MLFSECNIGLKVGILGKSIFINYKPNFLVLHDLISLKNTLPKHFKGFLPKNKGFQAVSRLKNWLKSGYFGVILHYF